jgi:hypothetical protein
MFTDRSVKIVSSVAGQLVKSVYYCDVTTHLNHMEGRMRENRLQSPER